MSNTISLLMRLQETGLAANRVAPTTEGGIAITLSDAELSVVIECYNDGSTYAIASDDESMPESWEIFDSEDDVERIRQYLDR